MVFVGKLILTFSDPSESVTAGSETSSLVSQQSAAPPPNFIQRRHATTRLSLCNLWRSAEAEKPLPLLARDASYMKFAEEGKKKDLLPFLLITTCPIILRVNYYAHIVAGCAEAPCQSVA